MRRGIAWSMSGTGVTHTGQPGLYTRRAVIGKQDIPRNGATLIHTIGEQKPVTALPPSCGTAPQAFA